MGAASSDQVSLKAQPRRVSNSTPAQPKSPRSLPPSRSKPQTAGPARAPLLCLAQPAAGTARRVGPPSGRADRLPSRPPERELTGPRLQVHRAQLRHGRGTPQRHGCGPARRAAAHSPGRQARPWWAEKPAAKRPGNTDRRAQKQHTKLGEAIRGRKH
ncbi:hypothetical protein NDU88_003255 [Pleurodeles waltl]|uniref:Uncharacterized protein n=1 Tax=Pleurodeles waltl TaxID=8319 RepID=A0AAV7P901_PLEWA|nr:hypothetical protein NDU88_003255 [Pleurodeles waltl]